MRIGLQVAATARPICEFCLKRGPRGPSWTSLRSQGIREWERAKLVASVYDRIVNDREVVEVELTEDAKRHGLAWALPEQVVVVLARPAGARRRQTTK
jgi:hypothetical protein